MIRKWSARTSPFVPGGRMESAMGRLNVILLMGGVHGSWAEFDHTGVCRWRGEERAKEPR